MSHAPHRLLNLLLLAVLFGAFGFARLRPLPGYARARR